MNDGINLVAPLKTFFHQERQEPDWQTGNNRKSRSRSSSRDDNLHPKTRTYMTASWLQSWSRNTQNTIIIARNWTRSWSKNRGRRDEYGMMIVVGLVCMYEGSKHEKITRRTRHTKTHEKKRFNARISKMKYRSLRVWIKMLTRTISPKQAYQAWKSETKQEMSATI